MTLPDLMTLRAGAMMLQLCPETGGSIARFSVDGTDLFRPAGDTDVAARDPRRLGSYPLFPFSNRVKHGRFTFQDKAYQLALNFGDHPHALHGNGWQRPWRGQPDGEAAAALLFDHDPVRDGAAAWPFAYSARQGFHLRHDGLDVELALRNEDSRPVPAAFGLHPYFPKTAQARLTAQLGGMWRADATLIPVEHVALPHDLDFSRGVRLADAECDNCFTGWRGAASIEWPEQRLRLTVEASRQLGNLVIFVPPGRDFFACEPVSNVNDAFNLAASGVADTGLAVLAPGETLTASVRFRVTRT